MSKKKEEACAHIMGTLFETSTLTHAYPIRDGRVDRDLSIDVTRERKSYTYVCAVCNHAEIVALNAREWPEWFKKIMATFTGVAE